MTYDQLHILLLADETDCKPSICYMNQQTQMVVDYREREVLTRVRGGQQSHQQRNPYLFYDR